MNILNSFRKWLSIINVKEGYYDDNLLNLIDHVDVKFSIKLSFLEFIFYN